MDPFLKLLLAALQAGAIELGKRLGRWLIGRLFRQCSAEENAVLSSASARTVTVAEEHIRQLVGQLAAIDDTTGEDL